MSFRYGFANHDNTQSPVDKDYAFFRSPVTDSQKNEHGRKALACHAQHHAVKPARGIDVSNHTHANGQWAAAMTQAGVLGRRRDAARTIGLRET